MNSRERVTAALRCEEPDHVPWCELQVDPFLADQLMEWGATEDQTFNLEKQQYTPTQARSIASKLNIDNITYVLRAEVYANKEMGKDGRLFYREGFIRTPEDMQLINLPDPTNQELYAEAAEFTEQKGDFSAWFMTRIGIFSTMLSIGLERFAINLIDQPDFVEDVLDIYCDWICVVAENVCDLGFDVFVSTDDLAFKTTTFFSPEVFHDLVLPRYQRVRKKISLPWLIHSDGNMMPFMDDLLSLNIAGFHPCEQGAMDIRLMKQMYGDRLCLMGNVDLNLLCDASPSEVEAEVQALIRDLAPGGGYILSSGNSLAGYLKPENILAMREAVKRIGRYPIVV
ncbi:MAG: hypothetical protein GTO18_09905 [Anaerolineales bacterium]|nr:hypothetical protein [Anaerolineales bacterium]